MTAKPLIVLAMGDPAGISPELTAKLVVQDDIRARGRIVLQRDGSIRQQPGHPQVGERAHPAGADAFGQQVPVVAEPDARVVAMEPPAMARVLRLDPAKLAQMVEDDPLLGHPVRHFAALGGVDAMVEDASPARILAYATR